MERVARRTFALKNRLLLAAWLHVEVSQEHDGRNWRTTNRSRGSAAQSPVVQWTSDKCTKKH